ncbi:Putative LOC100863861, partial [Caligus rogercresseyi]
NNQCKDNVLNAGFCKSIPHHDPPAFPPYRGPHNSERHDPQRPSHLPARRERSDASGEVHFNMQRERSEVAFYIFTYGKQSLGLNLSERFKITDGALERTPWPGIK